MARLGGMAAWALILAPLGAVAEHKPSAQPAPVVAPEPPPPVLGPSDFERLEIMIPVIMYAEGDWVVSLEDGGGAGTLMCEARTARGVESLGIVAHSGRTDPFLWFEDTSRTFPSRDAPLILFARGLGFEFTGSHEEHRVVTNLDSDVRQTRFLGEALAQGDRVRITTTIDDLTTWASLRGSAGALQALAECVKEWGGTLPF